MVLISIHPFVFRKIFLLAALLLGLSSVLCFADSLFLVRQYGPREESHGTAKLTGRPKDTNWTKPPFLSGKIDSAGDSLRPLSTGGFAQMKNGPLSPWAETPAWFFIVETSAPSNPWQPEASLGSRSVLLSGP
jgi:hypothetical protein